MQTEEQLKRIQQKLQLLLQQFQTAKKENARLKEELLEEKDEHQKKAARLDLLQQREEIVKSSKNELGTEEKKAFEKRLGQYVREIDRCIAILNE